MGRRNDERRVRPRGATGVPVGPPALLALEDGTVFPGRGSGATGEAFGEAVFNTASPNASPVAPNPRPGKTVPSSSARSAGGPTGTPVAPRGRTRRSSLRLPIGDDQLPSIHRVDHLAPQTFPQERAV